MALRKEGISATGRGFDQMVARAFRDGVVRDPVTVTDATLAASVASHAEKLIVLSRAAGQAVTLPAALGTGACFKFMVATTISSNTTTIKVANATDIMVGSVHTATTTTGAGTHEAAGGTDDTLTFDGTTTGGIAGSYVELTDAASGVWLLKGDLVGSGILATPLSATVS